MRNLFRSTLVGGLLLVSSPLAPAQNLLPDSVSHYDEIRMFRKFIGDTLDEHDYAKLEVCLDTIRQTRERFRSGAWLAPQFYRGLKVGGRVRSADQGDYLQSLERWKRAKPDSIMPLLAEADAYRGYAWDARGTGYSHTVSDSGWTDFDRYIAKAWQTLLHAEPLDRADPELYRQFVRIGRSHGIGKKALRGYFERGVELEPTYTPLYTSMAFALLPKWYGEEGEVEQFAETSAAALEGEDALELYTRIAWYVHDDAPKAFFERYDFDWDRMKKGFDTIEGRYPGSRFNRNSFCRMATRARDREAAARLFADLEEGWNDDKQEVWDSERVYGEFRAWASGEAEYPGQGELHLAVRGGDVEAVRELLSQGADPDVRADDGVTPLIQALESRHAAMVFVLLEAGADPEVTTDKGWYAIESAANTGQPAMVSVLLDHGCSPNSTDGAGWTPLHLAARLGLVDVVEVLLDHPDIEAAPRDERAKTPLHHAANGGHVEVIELLLEQRGIEVDARDKWEWTPLHYAARTGRGHAAARLMDAGADVNARNRKGHTPLKEAMRREQTETARMLRERGGAE